MGLLSSSPTTTFNCIHILKPLLLGITNFVFILKEVWGYLSSSLFHDRILK